MTGRNSVEDIGDIVRRVIDKARVMARRREISEAQGLQPMCLCNNSEKERAATTSAEDRPQVGEERPSAAHITPGGRSEGCPDVRTAMGKNSNISTTPGDHALAPEPENLGLHCAHTPPDRARNLDAGAPVFGHEADHLPVIVGQRPMRRLEQGGVKASGVHDSGCGPARRHDQVDPNFAALAAHASDWMGLASEQRHDCPATRFAAAEPRSGTERDHLPEGLGITDLALGPVEFRIAYCRLRQFLTDLGSCDV